MNGRVISINISKEKGKSKKPVDKAILIENFGIQGDSHAAPGERQISLLGIESIRKFKNKCPKINKINIGPGDFAENITTEGIDLKNLKIGTKLKIGECIIEISKIGKECHNYCEIYKKVGDCIMPKEGVFAKVIKPGLINVNDKIEVME